MDLPNASARVVKISGWNEKFRKLPEGRGVGLACSCYLTGAGLPIYWNAMPHSGVQLKLDRGGGVTVFCGASEIGQGSDDMLAAIVAEVLGIDTFDIRVYTGDTDLGPVDLGSYSSRVTIMAGNAALQAADRAKSLLAEAVAIKLEVPKEQLRFADHQRFRRRRPGTAHFISGSDLPGGDEIRDARHGGLVHSAEISGALQRRRRGAFANVFLLGGGGRSGSESGNGMAHSSEGLDRARHRARSEPHAGARTGRRQRVHGPGRGVDGGAWNSAACRKNSRTRWCTSSRRFWNTRARPRWTCRNVITELVEEPDPRGPFGAKEVGQGPLLPIMPAVANAVYDAVGVRVDESPITPEKIMKALAEKKAGRAPRFGPTHFPAVDWGETLLVPPPWEGGDG